MLSRKNPFLYIEFWCLREWPGLVIYKFRVIRKYMLLGTMGIGEIACTKNIDGIGHITESWGIQNVDLGKQASKEDWDNSQGDEYNYGCSASDAKRRVLKRRSNQLF